jgi:arylsulfatase
MPLLKGEVKESPRKEFLYWSDDGELLAVRLGFWKFTFSEQRVRAGLEVWREPFVHMRVHRLYNLRTDPFEEAPDSTMYYEEWFAKHAFLVVPAQTMVAKWLSTLKEFPIRQRPASFNLDSVVGKMMPRT